ncbi:MAG: hypothetical protein ACP5NG_03370 [Conexivisphaera sp.]
MDPSFKLIVDGSEVASGTLRRAIAPSAVAELERLRQLSGNAIMIGSAVVIVTRIKVGASKARRHFGAGEVALNPADGSLWFFAAESDSRMPLVPLGSITQGLDGLSSIRRGARVTVIVRSEQSPP